MQRVNAETHISVFRVQPNRERRYCVSWQSYDENLRLLSTPACNDLCTGTRMSHLNTNRVQLYQAEDAVAEQFVCTVSGHKMLG